VGKIGSLLKEKFNDDMISQMMKQCKTKDTLSINFSIAINEKGQVDEKLFYFNYKKDKELNNFVLKTLQDNLLFKPQVNECNQPLVSHKSKLSIKYLVENKEGLQSLKLLPYVDPDDQDVFISNRLEVAPMHKKCKSLKNNKALKKCLSTQVKLHINKKFRIGVFNKLNIECTTRIYVAFKVDKKGKIVDVRAISSHVELEKEAVRVVKKFPKVIPGIKEGEPVGVLYVVPIVIAALK